MGVGSATGRGISQIWEGGGDKIKLESFLDSRRILQILAILIFEQSHFYWPPPECNKLEE